MENTRTPKGPRRTQSTSNNRSYLEQLTAARLYGIWYQVLSYIFDWGLGNTLPTAYEQKQATAPSDQDEVRVYRPRGAPFATHLFLLQYQVVLAVLTCLKPVGCCYAFCVAQVAEKRRLVSRS